MADKKIKDVAPALAVNGAMKIPVSDGGSAATTVTVEQLKGFVGGGTIAVDQEVKAGSQNPVSGGAVYNELQKVNSGNGVSYSTPLHFPATYDKITLEKKIVKGSTILVTSETVKEVTLRTLPGDTEYITIATGKEYYTEKDVSVIGCLGTAGDALLTVKLDSVNERLFTHDTQIASFDSRITQNERIVKESNMSVKLDFKAEYQDIFLDNPIPCGAVINVTTSVSCKLTARTARGESPLVLTDGIKADRDIYMITCNEIAQVTLKCEKRSIMKELLETTENVDNIKLSYDSLENEFTLNFKEAHEEFNVPRIPRGAVIHIAGDISELTARTIPYEENPQEIRDGCAADRDINLLRCGTEIGNVTISFSYSSLPDRVYNIERKSENDDEKMSLDMQSLERFKGLFSDKNINELRKDKGKELKILALGNSWTLNATHYLGYFLDELGFNYKLVVCYSGAASFEHYWTCLHSGRIDFASFEWKDGKWNRYPAAEGEMTNVRDIILSDNWDIMTLQQMSLKAGKYETYQPYLHLLAERYKIINGVYPLYFFHATWAYPDFNKSDTFVKDYQGSSEVMYNAVLAAYNKAMDDEHIYNIFADTPIIQQVAKMAIEPTEIYTEDGTHLNEVGQFACSCVWLETLLRHFWDGNITKEMSVTKTSFATDYATPEQVTAIKQLAADIVANVTTYFPKAFSK